MKSWQWKGPLLNKWGQRASANQAKVYFGLKENDPWPSEGIIPTTINGYTFYVKALIPRNERTGLDPKWSWSVANPNRFMVICPVCGRHITYGRIHQHIIVHEDVTSKTGKGE